LEEGRRHKQLLDDLTTRNVLLNETGSTRSSNLWRTRFRTGCGCVVRLQAEEKGTELDWGYSHAISRISLFP
jgi:hypothetical protein